MVLLEAGTAGLTWLWVVFGFMALSAVGVAVMTFMTPMLHRTHGYLTLAILCIAATAYYSMAVNQGFVPISVDNDMTTQRSMYWARYVDWFLTTPLLLLDILLMTNLSIGSCLWIVGADVAMILLGLFGSLTASSQGFKWGFYAMSCFMQLAIVNGLFSGYKTTHLRAPKVRMVYLGLASYLTILWFGYPIVWGLAEGSNTISVTAEIGAYAILDLLTKVVFGWAIMASVPMLSASYKHEHDEGTYDSDILGAPIYSPFSKSRHHQDHHALRGNKRHPKTGTTSEPMAPNASTTSTNTSTVV